MVVIDIVRHAQGYHNLCKANHQSQDAALTELGKEQCHELRDVYPYKDKLKMLVASPMQRTIQTCLFTFGSLAPARTVIVAVPELQEVSHLPSDVGSDVDKLAGMFDAKVVDLSRVLPGWNKKGPDTHFAPTVAAVSARALEARRILRDLTAHLGPDDHVAVVSHGSFIHFLTEDFTGFIPEKFTGWKNVEMRSYVFADATGSDENATLQETPESRAARNVKARTEYSELFAERMGAIEAEGRHFRF